MPLDSLEYAIRPYVAPNAQGSILIPSTPRSSRERATLKWGGTLTVAPAVEAINWQSSCCKDGLTEQKRKTETVRVYQGGDESSPNYIDYERPLSVNLSKKESNTCGDNWDDMSVAAQEVNEVLSEWQSIMENLLGTPDKNCSAEWKFKSVLS